MRTQCIRLVHAHIATSLPCVLSAAVMLLCCGCWVEEQAIAVETVDVRGPQSYPPIHITHDSVSATRVAAHFSLNTKKTIDATFINEHGIPEIPGVGKVHWDLSQFEAGVDVNFPITHGIAFTGGASVAENLWGYNFGIGLHGGNRGTALRLDLGYQWQSLSYVVDYGVMTEVEGIFGYHSVTTQYLHEEQTETNGDFYGTLTVNTEWPVGSPNIFCQVGYSRRTIVTLDEFVVEKYGTSYIVVTPGMYLDVSPTVRIIAGARMAWDVGFETSEPSFFVTPVLLLDIGF